MKQIERLIARLVQLVEDSPNNIVTLIFVVDDKGVPVCWRVEQGKAEGLVSSENQPHDPLQSMIK